MSKDGPGFGNLDGTDVRVGIIKTRWNPDIIEPLTTGVKSALKVRASLCSQHGMAACLPLLFMY